MQEMNIKSDKEHKFDVQAVHSNTNFSIINEDILDKISMVYLKWKGYAPDPTRWTVDVLKSIEIQLIKDIKLNDDLALKYKDAYDAKFKSVEKDRKKKRNDNAQSKMLEEREIKIQKNMIKMSKRNNAIIFKGRPPTFKAKKKRLVKKITKAKQSQADIDFIRYIGKLTPSKQHES